MIAATLAVLVALGGVEIVGDATCPAPAEVAAQVATLGPAPVGDAPTAKVIVARTERALRLELVGPNSNALATRTLPAEGTCEDLAAAAAIVVAAWRADLDPNLTPQVRLLANATPIEATPTVVRAAPPRHDVPRSFEVDLGVIASDVAGKLVPGIMLLGTMDLGAIGLAIDSGLSATTSRTEDVGGIPDGVSWTRTTFEIGPALHLGYARLRGDIHLQALAALVHVRGGAGVPNATSDTTLELGVGAGARVALAGKTSTIWVGVDALKWPGDQELTIANDPFDQGRLPRSEVVLSLGIGFGRFP
ncbi:MAG TPA: hypothetical protein VH560_14755 [Polyangia bacterium]|jgi:hypothetical protein|nr:hypothetical protein [Polyangia bacterium]